MIAGFPEPPTVSSHLFTKGTRAHGLPVTPSPWRQDSAALDYASRRWPPPEAERAGADGWMKMDDEGSVKVSGKLEDFFGNPKNII